MATARLKKWGNSLAVIVPRDEVNRQGLRAGDLVEVDLRPAAPSLRSAFGTMRIKGHRSTLALIREAREGEDEA